MVGTRLVVACAWLVILLYAIPANAGPPAITGVPLFDRPALLNWPEDQPALQPDLTEPTANTLSDLHGSVGQCDMVLSTSGNYHMALRDLWYGVYLPHVTDLGMKNWFYTTSPPVSLEQIENQHLGVGNFRSSCRPQVAVGPQALMDGLAKQGSVEGSPVAVIRNRGNVILVRKGNPKNIQSIWDLGRDDVRVVFPHRELESGSFGNYSNSVYNIALNERGLAAADELFNRVFNNTTVRGKWLSGQRIHHREVPWSIAFGHADAGLLFYHLALYAVRTFPDRFDIVPLGGTVADPQPLPGNNVGTLQAVRIKGDWSFVQYTARERMMRALESTQFTAILQRHGLDRP